MSESVMSESVMSNAVNDDSLRVAASSNEPSRMHITNADTVVRPHVTLTLDDLTQDVKKALQLWERPESDGSPLTHLLLYRYALRDHGRGARHATNQVLLDGLAELEGQHSESAEILRARFPDGLTVREAANRFNVVEGTIQKKQREGWEELAAILYAKEQATRTEQHEHLLARIEAPSYRQLCGVDQHLHTLTELIQQPDGPRIIALEGIGGIGKTALANGLLRHLIAIGVVGAGMYPECAWVTARQTNLNVGGLARPQQQPALTSQALLNELCTQLFASEGYAVGLDSERMLGMLQQRFAAQPYLVVVDNLETVQDVEALLETLRQLVDPMRIILTTRHSLFAEPDIYHFAIPPLDEIYALDLVRAEAKQRNLPHLAAASEEELQPIYATVGGNPLALRLVVGQTHVHGLTDVLDDLAHAQGQPIENLYKYIYETAWQNLNETERAVFLSMGMVGPSGVDFAFLADINEIAKAELRDTLNRLVSLNLINSHGGLNERWYTIHSLTRTFLLNDIGQLFAEK